MSRPKKTVEVQMIKDFANQQLAHPNNTMEEKLGIINMLEKILFMSNAYNGFMFLGNTNEDIRLGSEEWVCRKYF
jgi:hypothetical protein